MSGQQTGPNVSFDEFCEQLCRGCRVVRWLGKADPPESNLSGGEYCELSDRPRNQAFQPSECCPLCQQIRSLVPAGTVIQGVRVYLRRVTRELSNLWKLEWMGTAKGTPYDLLRICVNARPKDAEFTFGVLPSRSFEDPTSPLISAGAGTDSQMVRMAVRAVQTDLVDYDMVRCWLDACTKYHGSICMPTRTVVVPRFKVIDCLTRTVVSPAEQAFEYAAISYVWGSADKRQENCSTYPKTIEDSLTVTLALGLRYLWVDRYCIDQEDANEKHIQINLMHCIYAQAQFTIVAGSGDAWTGLPGVSDSKRRAQERLRIGDIDLLSMPLGVNDRSKLSWSTRAWTFQEGSISRRKIIFLEDEVLFLCEQMHCLESVAQTPPPWPDQRYNWISDYHIRSLVPSVYKVGSGTLGSSIMHAEDLLKAYFPRAMSFPSDALRACLGMLNAVGITHYWGIPIISWGSPFGHFLASFLWLNNGPGEERREFPSWSWTRWSGGKRFHVTHRAPSVLVEIKLDSGQWVGIGQTNVVRGNVNELSSGKTLRLTGTTVTPQFTKTKNDWFAEVTTIQGYVLRLQVSMDSAETVLEDLQDALLMVYDDLRDECYGKGVHQTAWTHGAALVVVPRNELFVRIGVGHDPRVISFPGKGQVEVGVFSLENASRRTIYLE